MPTIAATPEDLDELKTAVTTLAERVEALEAEKLSDDAQAVLFEDALVVQRAKDADIEARIRAIELGEEVPPPPPPPDPDPDPVPIPPTPTSLALAMHSGHNGATTISRLNAVGQWLGKPVKTAAYFTGGGSGGWAQIEGPSWLLRDNCRAWLSGGADRQVSLQLAMMPSGLGITLAQVAAGEHDAHYRALANNLATHGLLGIELRPAHEFDGGWYPWGVKGKPELNASFVAAFRRMVTVMRAAQPTNKWVIVWNPTNDNWPLTNSLAYLESLWPGDSYVDQVGSDLYDKSMDTGKVYYPSGSDRLTRQKEVWVKISARLAIMRQFAQSHGKPLQFPEWGLMQYNTSGNYAGWGGGDNPYFIEQMHKWITDPANNVAMHSYFDVKNMGGDDHRISPAQGSVFLQSQAKFKQLFGSSV